MDLEKLKQTIELMDANNQLEILNICVQSNLTINENNHGVMINLSCVSPEVLEKIQHFVNYVKDQEKELLYMENMKKEATQHIVCPPSSASMTTSTSSIQTHSNYF